MILSSTFIYDRNSPFYIKSSVYMFYFLLNISMIIKQWILSVDQSFIK